MNTLPSKEWRIAPGDPTHVFDPKSAKPINCFSKERAALIVAAVNAHAAETPEQPTPHHVRWDFLGWLCSVCGGWNDGTSRSCRWPHEHAAKASDGSRHAAGCGIFACDPCDCEVNAVKASEGLVS